MKQQRRGKALGSVRIIGGEWRSRRISVASAQDLRPTSDRARESLFNWLMPYLAGANCLDLFAGTGILGFEALSRGAHAATMVEKDKIAADALRLNAKIFDHPSVTIFHQEALTWLRSATIKPFDIVFLDPPFGGQLIGESLGALSRSWLTDNALVYVESGESLKDIALPETLEWTKQAQLGNVSIGLAAVRGAQNI